MQRTITVLNPVRVRKLCLSSADLATMWKLAHGDLACELRYAGNERRECKTFGGATWKEGTDAKTFVSELTYFLECTASP